jgi:hypothetical protein
MRGAIALALSTRTPSGRVVQVLTTDREISMIRFASRFLGMVPLAALLASCGAAPAAEVQAAIAEDIHAQDDALTLTDPRSGAALELAFDHVHEGVEETAGGRYVACVDFRGTDGTLYDVDYYVDREGEGYRVEDVVLHKADGENVISDEERARLEAASK